jgi:iron complex transport system ATP-binding protein
MWNPEQGCGLQARERSAPGQSRQSGLVRFHQRRCAIHNVAVNDPILELTGATVVKDGRRVLDNVSLTISEGEHTAIVGPNGAGKSILVSLLTHTERPIAPKDDVPPVRVFGKETWNIFDLRSQLGVVSAALQHYFVNGNSEGSISGEAAVVSAFLNSYGILRYGELTDEMRNRAAAALAAAGAGHLADRMLDEMSSGEARRVLLARAFATAPRALILDEPTTGLDLVARHSFMESVRGLARAGTTLVLITHHVEEIVPEISRVVLLREGRIAADGPRTAVLTAENLSGLFGHPILIESSGQYQYARPAAALQVGGT